MSLFSGKVIGLVLVVLIVLGFATGYIFINHDKTKCLNSKRWTFEDGFRTWFAIGRYELRYLPVNYDCPGDKYDPAQYKNDNGVLVPIQ